jgi:hypothetical protein
MINGVKMKKQNNVFLMGCLLVVLGIGFVGCSSKKKGVFSSYKLNNKQLKEQIVGQKVYGITNYSRQPYVVFLAPNNRVEIKVGDETLVGSYTIKNDMVFTKWNGKGDTHYVSKDKRSRFYPGNPFHKSTIDGEFGLEYWKVDIDSPRKEIYLLDSPLRHDGWRGPCFIYKD